jgi:Rrf2 family protein
MPLQLTRAADYAILAMMHLGSMPEGSVALKDDIATAQNISPSFMAKILRQLVKTGLLHSARGVKGGFGLQRAAAEINLLDIVEGIEGPIQSSDQAADHRRSTSARSRPTSDVWLEVQHQLIVLLRRTTLEGLLSTTRKDRRADYKLRV